MTGLPQGRQCTGCMRLPGGGCHVTKVKCVWRAACARPSARSAARSPGAGPGLGSAVIKAALATRRRAGRPGRRSDLRQRGQRRPGPERGPPGGDRRGPEPRRRRDDGQQGLRLGPEGGHAGRPGDPVRRRGGGRRRRHGEHVAARPTCWQGPRRLPHGQRRTDRLDDPRRPVGRLQQRAHGHLRRPLRREVRASPASSRTTSPSPATSGRSQAQPERRFRRRDRAGRGHRPARRPSTVSEDEKPKKFNEEKLRKLRPAFGKEGTVTAGNASSINDGAAALVVLSPEKVKALGLKPQARILGYATLRREPEWFTLAPIGAIAEAAGASCR